VGDSFILSGVASGQLNLSSALDQLYVSGSGVYAVEERIYAIDASGSSPKLTVTVDGGSAQPLVDNVEALTVAYVTTPCPPCNQITAPAQGSSDWTLVREVAVSVTVRSAHVTRSGQYIRLSDTTNVKPRNLI
jgi:hypothetical protein